MTSHLKTELALKYFLKKARPITLVALVAFTLWFTQMTVALANVPVSVTILK